MPRILIITCCMALISVLALAEPPANTVKVLPHGVEYPMIRTHYYPPLKTASQLRMGQDPYRLAFGVHKFLNAVQDFTTPEFEIYRLESEHWNNIYGGYGVLGHGEEVFTQRAAYWRKVHQGR